MAMMPKDKRVFAALRDPEVLAYMKKDPQFLGYFFKGELNVQVPEETRMDRLRMRLWRLFR